MFPDSAGEGKASVTIRQFWNLVVWSVCIVFCCYLNERKRDPWGKKLILQLQLVRDVPLQPLFFKHLPLLHHVKQRARGHRNGHCAAGFGLEIKSRPMFTTAVDDKLPALFGQILYVQRCCHWRNNDAPSNLHCSRTRFQCRRLSSIIIYVLSSFSRRYHCRSGIGRCCHSQLVYTNNRLPDGASSLFSRCQIMLWQLPCLFLRCCRGWTVLLSQCLLACSYCCCGRDRETDLLCPASLLCGSWVPLSISTTQWRHQPWASVSHNDLFFLLFSVNFNHKNKMNK